MLMLKNVNIKKLTKTKHMFMTLVLHGIIMMYPILIVKRNTKVIWNNTKPMFMTLKKHQIWNYLKNKWLNI